MEAISKSSENSSEFYERNVENKQKQLRSN